MGHFCAGQINGQKPSECDGRKPYADMGIIDDIELINILASAD